MSSEVVSKSVGVFSRALGGKVEYRRNLWHLMEEIRPGRITVLVDMLGLIDRNAEHIAIKVLDGNTGLPVRL